MVLAIVLVGCVPLVIGLVLASMAGMRDLGHVIGGNFQAIAEQVAERVSLLVHGEVQNLRLLASAPLRVRLPVSMANAAYPDSESAVAALIERRAREWEQGREADALLNPELSRFLLEHTVNEGDKVVGLLITDAHGAVVAASSPPDQYVVGREPWWQRLHDDPAQTVYISDVIAARKGSFRSPDETIDIAVPILDEHQHRVIGAIKASYRLDALFALVNQVRIGQTGHAMLFNAAGQPVVCPILPRQAHRIPETLMRHIVSDEPGWIVAEDDGHGAHETVVGFAPVSGLGTPENGWHIFVRQHPSESYAPIWEQFRKFGLIGLLMVTVLAAMARYVGARIAHPIQVLHKGVESIRRGDYRGPLAVKTGDEFEELAGAIDRMAANLQQSRAELEALNQELARRVEEKTAEVASQMRKLELSERLAALGKVASGVAHEINNPLGIIVNRIECMEAEATDWPLPQDVARDLAAIRAQAERISRVTQSMLSLSRGAATTLKPIDLNCLIRSTLTVAGERVSARGLTIESVLDPALPPVMGDRVRLETVVLNLINNAIDAVQSLGGEGRIRVESGRAPTAEGEWVTVRVLDNGPGIPAAMLGRIFDPFFTTKPAGQGNGLGLFLSYAIVAEHRGRLEAANGGPGAILTVSLPALGGATQEQESGWESTARS